MDCATYRQLFGQITNSCVTYHHNFPGHNLLSIETLVEVSKNLNDDIPGDEFLGSFPCYQEFPYAVWMSFPLFSGSGITDHAGDLVDKKLNWETKLKKLRISNIDKAVHLVKKLRRNKPVKLSESLKKYVEHFHSDPEPMFSGNYNWLYTGGCLTYDEFSNETTLISADYQSRKAGFCLLKLNKALDEVEYKSFSSLKAYSPVLQIKCKSQLDNLLISVRQKNYLTLYKANRGSHLYSPVKLWRKKVLNTKLLTCTDLKDNCEEVILTDSNLDVHVFHVERKEKISSYSGRKIAAGSKSRWSQVAFGDSAVYLAVRKCFAILDLRDFHSGTKLYPTAIGNQCEEICSFVASSTDSNFVYLSTTHSLLQVDLRNGKSVQRWTHMMKSSPQFMANIKDAGNEFLVLQSQIVGETCGIVNESLGEGTDVKFVSKSLPCLLRSMVDSLSLAHMRGVCLNPFLRRRVNFAVTGMLCLKNDEGEVVLLTKNSSGDVFLTKIRKKTAEFDENQEEIVERMKVYESHFENLPPEGRATNHPELFDMNHLTGRFCRPDVKWKKPEIRWKYREMYAPESLRYFKDVLARKILTVWGHETEDFEKEEKEEAMSVDLKVREWMEKC